MNYREFLETRSKKAISEYKELENKCARLAVGDGWDREALEVKLETMTSDMAVKRQENHALQLRIDAQNTAIDGLDEKVKQLEHMVDTLADASNRSYQLEKEEKARLTGRIDGLKSAIKLITRERGE